VDESRTMQSEWLRQRMLVGPDGALLYPELEERYLSMLRLDCDFTTDGRAEWMGGEMLRHLHDMMRHLYEMRDREAFRLEAERRRNLLEEELAREARRRRSVLEAELAAIQRGLDADLMRVWFNHLRGEYRVLGDRSTAEGETAAYQEAYMRWPAYDYTPDGRRRADLEEARLDEGLDAFNDEAEGPAEQRRREEWLAADAERRRREREEEDREEEE
jgi:hypothetical protein